MAIVWLIVCIILFFIMFLAALFKVSGESSDAEAVPIEPFIDALYDETPEPVIRWPVPLDGALQDHIMQECRKKDVDPSIVFAVISVETHGTFDPDLRGDDGEALGLMQIWPYWHADRMTRLNCKNLLDPYQNVTVGIDILSELLNTYDIDGALQYYNSGSETGAPGYAYTVQRTAECLLEGRMVVK